MPTFKDFLNADMETFFNTGEFADLHDIDGQQIQAVVDSDILKTRGDNQRDAQYEGVFRGEVVVLVQSSYFPERPVIGQHMRLDGKLYLVADCAESQGVLEITLGANES